METLGFQPPPGQVMGFTKDALVKKNCKSSLTIYLIDLRIYVRNWVRPQVHCSNIMTFSVQTLLIQSKRNLLN